MSTDILAGLQRGYAIWLEPTHLHFHSGGQVEVKALWGPRMQKDGTGNPRDWQAYVTGPGGEELEAEITYGEGEYAGIYFQAGEEGLYHALVENKAGIHQGCRYTQWAGLIIPVGHHVHGSGTARGKGLELVPGEFKEFHLGDTVDMQVLFNGKPLPGANVYVTYHLYEGEQFPHSKTTGGDGKFEFTFDNKGHWMFLVNHKTNENEPALHAGTFVIAGVR